MLDRWLRAFQSLRELLRTHGVRAMARQTGSYLRLLAGYTWAPRHPFDQQHGVHTGGVLRAARLRSGHPNDAHMTAYYGTHPSLLRGILERWEQILANTLYALHDYTLVDIGCGKGRVLMVASDFPFHSIIGVELSPALCEIARTNLDRWQATPHACNDLSIVQSDVLAFELPDSPLLLYLFHPFEEPLLRRWLEQLAGFLRTRRTSIDLVYCNPQYEDPLRRMPEAILLWSEDVPFSPEDAKADAFHVRAQRVSLYRLNSGG